MNQLRHRFIYRTVRSAMDAALEPAEADPDLGLPKLERLLTGRRPLEDACLGLGVIYAILTRAITGTSRPATTVNLAFGYGDDPATAHLVDAGEVPPLYRTFGQCLSAVARHDWGTYTALFDGYVAGDLDRARELLEVVFRRAVPAVAAVPCTCGDCR